MNAFLHYIRKIGPFLCLMIFWSCTVAKKSPRCTIVNEFGLPYIDLSRDTSRQHIVARQNGTYFGHPTTLKTRDASNSVVIFATYPVGGHARGAAAISKSVDRGITWNRIAADSSLGQIKEVPTIHKLSDRDGKERFLIFTGLYPVRMSISNNNGYSWSSFRKVGNWGGIVTMSDLVPVKNNAEDKDFAAGKYMAFFHDDGRFFDSSNKAYNPRKFILYSTTTEDGGLTWSFPTIIRVDTTMMLCEPGLVRSPDGKELAMLLRENSRKHPSQIIFSRDEGRTWTNPQSLPPSLCGDRHVIRYAPDGRLVIVFRDYQPAKATGPTEGDYVAWVGTYSDLHSKEKGQYRLRLLDNFAGYDAGYSGLELLDDGTFVATTYLQYRPYDAGNNSVISVRFNLKETDRLAGVKK